MGIARSTLSGLTRQSQDESAPNLVVSSPAPAVASLPGVSTSNAGSHTSPAPEVPPLRRSRRLRRPAVPVVDERVPAPRQAYKRRRVAAIADMSQEAGEGSTSQVPQKEPSFPCPVCLSKMDEPSSTTCGHIFCTNCIKQAIQAQDMCPICRKRLKISNIHRVYLPDTTC